MGVDKEVLRVADGREHAAEVGGNGLPAHGGHDEADAPGLGENHDGQRDEDNQGHIIGDEHGTKIAAEDEEPSQGAAGGIAAEELLEDGGKETAEP